MKKVAAIHYIFTSFPVYGSSLDDY